MMVIQIVGLATGGPSLFDGEYLVDYDPDREGVSPDGEPMLAVLRTTPRLEEARRYTPEEAFECWRRKSTRWPRRPDGKPNRPLTAFTVTMFNPEKRGA
jgi:hypothetical protein